MTTYKTSYDENLKIWSGEKVARKFAADTLIGEAALDVMQKNGEKVAQICHHNGKQYKYKELARMTINVAKYFTKLDLQQGDVIGLCASNSDFVAPVFFGALLKGLIVHALDKNYDKADIKHALNISKPSITFCNGEVYNKVKEALQECGLSNEIYTMQNHIAGVKNVEEIVEEKSDSEFNTAALKDGGSQTAVIICSSGTTGPPKGVTMSHEDLLNATFLDLKPNDRILCFSSLSWYSGLYALVWGTLTGLTRIIHEPGYTAEILFDIVKKYQVTVLLTAPSHLAAMLGAPRLRHTDLSSIRLYGLGGSPLIYNVVKQMEPYFPNAVFYNGYGMSEVRTAAAGGVCREAGGYIGQLADNCMYKIVNVENEHKPQQLGPNEVGELYFKNIYKWLGYYGNERATAAALDVDGWLRTGDLGYFDDAGNLYVVDRLKNICKYHGYHYSPTEIEHVIYELSDVVEVCVFGMPDLIAFDLPAAAVVRKNGSNLTEEQIYEHVEKRMADYKRLRGGVYFFENLPKTTTGKILRSECKKICEKLRNEKLNAE